VPSRTPTLLAVLTCGSCAERNPERARFCLSCGAPLAAPVVRHVRKIVTVLFCDIAQSTNLGERLDAEALRAVLDRYFLAVRTAVESHGGVVEKFIGDAVMAVFGLPDVHEDDALRAVRASVDVLSALAGVNETLVRRWDVRLQVRIGLHTGEVLAESAVTGQRLATGDAVNAAARIQSQAGVDQVLLGPATFRLVRHDVRAEAMAPVQLKGKAAAVQLYRLVDVREPEVRGPGASEPTLAVGRTRELQRLQQTWSATVRARQPRRQLVLGDVGIGKSRLVSDFLAGVADATVLQGRCLSYGQGITFWPVREMISSVAGWREGESVVTSLQKLAQVMGGRPDAETIADRIGQLLGLTPAVVGLPELTHALCELVQELAARRPVLLVVEDLHWAERTLIDVLDHVHTRVQGPVLLLCSARPEVFQTHAGWAPPSEERLTVGPLSQESVLALLQAMVAPAELPVAVRDHVLNAAEGNPLFVEQLVGALVDDDAEGGGQGTRRFGGGTNGRELPVSLTAVLTARLERLDPAEQRALGAGAVIGRVFWHGAVAALLQDAVGAQVGQQLLALVDRQLLLPESTSFPQQLAYKFRHVLMQDAAYGSLPKAERARAHAAFTGWLQEIAGERAGEYEEILGYHLEQAVQLRRAIGRADEEDRALAIRAGRCLAAAGRHAYARGDMAGTVNLLSRAERLLEDDPVTRLDVVVVLGHALDLTGRFAEAAGVLTEGVATATALGERQAEARLRLELINHAQWAGVGVTEDLERRITEAIGVMEEVGDHAGLADAWVMAGKLRLDAGHAGAAEHAFERATVHVKESRAAAAGRELAIFRIMTLVLGPTPVAEVFSRLKQIAEERSGDLGTTTEVLRGQAVVAAMKKQFDEASQFLAEGRHLLEQLGLQAIAASCAHNEYEIALRRGDLSSCEAALREADEVLTGMGEQGARSTVLAMLAHVDLHGRSVGDAAGHVRLARELAADGDFLTQVLWRSAHGKVVARSGKLGEAEAAAREAVELAGASDWLCVHGSALLDLADVHVQAGRTASAADASRAAVELFEAKGDLALRDQAMAVLRNATTR
jgi:class 3 adenylate cyclase/tetratricopeptide (TPR) repeat protein